MVRGRGKLGGYDSCDRPQVDVISTHADSDKTTMAASNIQEIVGRATASLRYLKLKPEQETDVLSFIGDVFVCLPTGYLVA